MFCSPKNIASLSTCFLESNIAESTGIREVHQTLKLSYNKKDLNDVTAAPFFGVFFAAGS